MVSFKLACAGSNDAHISHDNASTILLHFTLVTAARDPLNVLDFSHRYNVTDSVRDALETLVKHASNQNKRIR